MDRKDKKDIADIIDDQQWLTPVAIGVQNFILHWYTACGRPGQAIKNLWHGTWMGHPLHPALTDIPIGGWSVALVFDLIDSARGSNELGAAAETAIGIGLVGAMGAAKSGLTDYAASGEQAPRAGLVHGLLNTCATCFYLASWLARRRGDRESGRNLSYAGFALMVAASYLGGDLVSGQRIGVDHAEREGLPGDWTAVLNDNELGEDEIKRVEAKGIKILLARQGGRIGAIGEVCSHLGGPLAEGELKDGCVTCPWHASRFRMDNGAVVDGPATFRQPVFETRVASGKIEVKAACSVPFEI